MMNKLERCQPTQGWRYRSLLVSAVGAILAVSGTPAMASEVDELRALRSELELLKKSYVNEVRRLRVIDARLLAVQARLKAAGVEPDGQVATPEAQPTTTASADTGTESAVGRTEADKQKATKRSVDDFLQQEHVAFDRPFVLEAGVTYSRYDRNQLSLNGFLALDAIFLGNIAVDNVASDTMTYTLAARYGLSPRWNVGVSVPFLQRWVSYQKGGAGGSAASYAEISRTGDLTVGDTTLNVSYRLLPETASRPDVVLTGNVIVPTGKAPYGIDWETVQGGQDADGNSFVQFSVPSEQATGNGLWGYGLTLSMVKTLDPALVFANLGYTGYVSRHFDDLDIDPATKNPGEVSLGSSFSYGLGVAFALNDRTSLSMSLSQQLTRQAKTRYDGQDWVSLIGSDANSATFNLGMTYALSRKITLVTILGVGLTPDAPDFSLGIKVPYAL